NMKELTTTSYAILGWLALRPWTTYELARQMRLNFRFFWPRVESRLYSEPKNLVAHGLAMAERTYTGKRARTTYAITAEGRRALEGWLGQESAMPALQFEALVRVFFGGFGTREQLLATIDSARALADEIQAAGAEVAFAYIEGRYPFPQRVHLSGLVFDFLWGFAEHLRAWADRSVAEVSTWEDVSPDGKRERAVGVFAAALAEK